MAIDEVIRAGGQTRCPRCVRHLSEAESKAKGKEARAKVPRDSHAVFEPAPDRPDPVSLLEEQATTRVPELVPIRYGRMLVSPFTFFRGAALIMASDLSTTPALGPHGPDLRRRPPLQLRGLRLARSASSSSTATTSTRRCPGPGSGTSSAWRPASSSPAASRGFSKSVRAEADRRPRPGVPGGHAADGGHDQPRGLVLPRRDRGRASTLLQAAGGRHGLQGRGAHGGHRHQADREGADQGLHEGARQADHGRRRRAPDHQRPAAHRAGRGALPRGARARRWSSCSTSVIRQYRQSLPTDRRHLLEQYQFSQMARKVVGVGSVGTRAWIILLHGPSHEDVLFLQAKEAEASVLERFTKKSQYANHGARVVAGQRLMQASSDIFLGWQRTDGIDGVSRDYYIRQLQDWKGSVDTDNAIPAGHEGSTASCAPTRWPGPTPARATGSPSRRTSATTPPSRRRWPSSPSPTPTRTSGTTRRSPPPARAAGSTPRRGSEPPVPAIAGSGLSASGCGIA